MDPIDRLPFVLVYMLHGGVETHRGRRLHNDPLQRDMMRRLRLGQTIMPAGEAGEEPQPGIPPFLAMHGRPGDRRSQRGRA